MKTLLENRFAPLTFRMGFIEAGLEVCSHQLLTWRMQHVMLTRLQQETRDFGSLENALGCLTPLSTIRRRELLLETRSTWTAYFDNRMQGGDPVPVMSYLAKQIGCRSLAIECTPQTLRGRGQNARGSYGAVQFELFGPKPTEFLNFVRAVSVANDGGRWKFTLTGQEQPFEKPENYKRKSIRERFTPEMLKEYCEALGIDPFEAEFYGPRGTRLVDTTPLPPDHQEAELEDVRTAVMAE